MRSYGALSPLLLLFLSTPAVAKEPGTSPVALVDHLRLGFGLIRAHGRLPSTVAGGEYRTTGLRLQLAGGRLGGEASDLGSRLGVEGGLALVLAPAEGQSEGGLSATFEGQLLGALKVWTFELPVKGALVLGLGVEVGLGGQPWWSGPTRLTTLGQGRLVVGRSGAQAELTYGFAPWTFTGRGDGLPVRRIEHRLQASVGADTLGLVVSYRRGQVRDRIDQSGEASIDDAVTLGVEWRK